MNIKNLKVGDKVILFSLAYVKKKWAKEIEEDSPDITTEMEKNWDVSKKVVTTDTLGRDKTPRVELEGWFYKPEWVRRRIITK
jgi:hypothetical protein